MKDALVRLNALPHMQDNFFLHLLFYTDCDLKSKHGRT